MIVPARTGRWIVLLVCVLPVLALQSLRAGAENWNKRAIERIKTPPLGLPPVLVPPDNEPTADKIALGRKLFFDRRLSSNNTMSCGMCHVPEQGFTSNELSAAIGVEGRSGRRNSPTLFNVAYQKRLFHDARDNALETQIFGPMLAHNEMANPSIGWLLEKIKGLDDYPALFAKAFNAGPDVRTLGWALASYERSLLSGNSPFDRWLYGKDANAMSAQAKKGYELFVGKARCALCHSIGDDHALFTDHQLHNNGVGAARDAANDPAGPPVSVEIAPGVTVSIERKQIDSVGHAPLKDFGRLEVTDNPEDLYRYKTPSLRNVALTAPYMHDGSLRTLRDVVEFYNRGGYANPGLDPLIRPLGLAGDEVSALVAFLNALTGDNVDALIADARSTAVGN